MLANPSIWLLIPAAPSLMVITLNLFKFYYLNLTDLISYEVIPFGVETSM